MLGEKIQSALNDQINLELTAFYTYLSMSGFFESEGLKGFASWMRHHSDEEMVHAMKIYDFINARRGRVLLQPIAAPPVTWARPLDVFTDALKHEQKVTAAINKLVGLARAEQDYATDSFLQWFVDEQVEEEEIVADVIDDLKRTEDFGPGLFLLNRELEAHAKGGDNESAEDPI